MRKKKTIYLEKIFPEAISAAHSTKDTKNPKNSEGLHGHNYSISVRVSGEKNEDGMIINLKDLTAVVKKEIIEKLDHQNLDTLFPSSTMEMLAEWACETIGNAFPSLTEIRVRISETSRSSALCVLK